MKSNQTSRLSIFAVLTLISQCSTLLPMEGQPRPALRSLSPNIEQGNTIVLTTPKIPAPKAQKPKPIRHHINRRNPFPSISLEPVSSLEKTDEATANHVTFHVPSSDSESSLNDYIVLAPDSPKVQEMETVPTEKQEIIKTAAQDLAIDIWHDEPLTHEERASLKSSALAWLKKYENCLTNATCLLSAYGFATAIIATVDQYEGQDIPKAVFITDALSTFTAAMTSTGLLVREQCGCCGTHGDSSDNQLCDEQLLTEEAIPRTRSSLERMMEKIATSYRKNSKKVLTVTTFVTTVWTALISSTYAMQEFFGIDSLPKEAYVADSFFTLLSTTASSLLAARNYMHRG